MDYVIERDGIVERNDDETILIQASKAHAARVVKWLALKGRIIIRPATAGESAQGSQTRMHQHRARQMGPGW